MNRFKTVRIFYIGYTDIGTRTTISSNIPFCVCIIVQNGVYNFARFNDVFRVKTPRIDGLAQDHRISGALAMGFR